MFDYQKKEIYCTINKFISAYLSETSIQSKGVAVMNKEFIGSEFTRCNFKFPSSRILEEGNILLILIRREYLRYIQYQKIYNPL